MLNFAFLEVLSDPILISIVSKIEGISSFMEEILDSIYFILNDSKNYITPYIPIHLNIGLLVSSL